MFVLFLLFPFFFFFPLPFVKLLPKTSKLLTLYFLQCCDTYKHTQTHTHRVYGCLSVHMCNYGTSPFLFDLKNNTFFIQWLITYVTQPIIFLMHMFFNLVKHLSSYNIFLPPKRVFKLTHQCHITSNCIPSMLKSLTEFTMPLITRLDISLSSAWTSKNVLLLYCLIKQYQITCY